MTSAATVWHSSYSPVAEQIMASDQDRKQFLEMYAKMNPSDAAAEEMNNKLKWDIIRKYHEPISKLTQVKTGKYAGQWHTYMKGVDGTAPRQYKRFKTFDDAYQSYQPPLQMGVYYWPLRGIVLVPPEAGFATHYVLAAAISGSLLHPQVYRSLPVL